MGAYAARRLVWLPFLLIIVTFVTFALLRFGPGDPVQVWLGQHQNDEVRARLRAQLGLDDPLVVQYVHYVEGVVTRLDFGESFQFRGKSVGELLAKRIPVSLQLNLAAIIITLGVGIPVGLFAALRQGTGVDNVVVAIALAFQSLPVFITAPVLLLVFALYLDILPTSGWGGFFSPKIVMPAVVMGVPGIAIVVRLVRASVLDVLGQDYIRTARAKGAGGAFGALEAHPEERHDSGGYQLRVHDSGTGRRNVHSGNLLWHSRSRFLHDQFLVRKRLSGDHGVCDHLHDAIHASQSGS